MDEEDGRDSENNGQERLLRGDPNLSPHQGAFNCPTSDSDGSSNPNLTQNPMSALSDQEQLMVKYWRSKSLPVAYLPQLGILHQTSNGGFELVTQPSKELTSNNSPSFKLLSEVKTEEECETHKRPVLHTGIIGGAKGKALKDFIRGSSAEQVCGK